MSRSYHLKWMCQCGTRLCTVQSYLFIESSYPRLTYLLPTDKSRTKKFSQMSDAQYSSYLLTGSSAPSLTYLLVTTKKLGGCRTLDGTTIVNFINIESRGEKNLPRTDFIECFGYSILYIEVLKFCQPGGERYNTKGNILP